MPQGDFPLFYAFHFYLFGIVAIVSALLFVTRKSPVAAALWLVNTMFCLAALYILLDAQFIGAIQVLVYAGAIMVVFLFVIMLLNLGHPSELADARSLGWKLAAGFVGLALIAEVFALTRVRVPESLFFSAVLFTIGVVGVLTRRNAIIIFMCVELMLNAVNLAFVAFAQVHGVAGQVFVFFVMTVAAAEAAVGLAIIIALFRHKQTVNLQQINLLKG